MLSLRRRVQDGTRDVGRPTGLVSGEPWPDGQAWPCTRKGCVGSFMLGPSPRIPFVF